MLKESILKILYWISDRSFGRITKNIEIDSLRKRLTNVDYPYSVGRYIGLAITSAVLLSIVVFIAVFLLFHYKIIEIKILWLLPLFIPIGVIIFALFWPTWDLSKKKKQIDANLPLAILTMSTVSEAGAPPHLMFESIAGNPDYPRLGKECAKLQRFMHQLGLSFGKAINKTIEITPSQSFKTFLKELNTTVKSGGDLKEFMAKRADNAYFEYSLALEKAAERAETLGEIYSIIMIAAPIFFFFVVVLLGWIGSGGFMGWNVDELLNIGIFGVIPIANVCFILIMHMLSTE